MKRRNIIIIIAVVVIGLIALIVAKHGSRKATFKQDFQVEDIASVTKLYLADKLGGEVTLSKTSDSAWIVDGQYPASQAMVDMLLQTLNTMRIRQQVNRSAIPNVTKDLAARAVKCEVYQRTYFIDWFGGKVRLFPREKNTVTYYAGRETQDMMACYMYREGDKMPYIIHIPGFRGYLTPRFATDPLKWRSHTIVDLNVKAIERVSMQIPASSSENFEVVREGEGFYLKLADGQRAPQFDTARVAQMLASFTWLNFDEYASLVPGTSDTSFSIGPRAILTITDTAGVSRELKTYIKYTDPEDLKLVDDPTKYNEFDVDRLYAIIDNTDTVLIQFFTFDNILQPASYFMGADNTLVLR